jgi:NADH dehydrogenase
MAHPPVAQPHRRRARNGILILGGGFGGATVAQNLGLHGATIVSPENSLLFTPMLPEAASGTLESRHVVVPLRQMCRHSELFLGRAVGHDPATRTVRVETDTGPAEIVYDDLVVALGSVSRTLPIPGLAEHGIGFKSFADAIYLRNQVLRELELADNERDDEAAEAHLSFVFVGAGYAGVEALAELFDLVADAMPYYPGLRRLRQRWVLVEALDRILPQIPTRLGEYADELLRRRGVEIRTSTKLRAVHADRVELDDGTVVPSHTLVWSAGVAPDPLLPRLGLPLDDRGRVRVDGFLRVEGHEHVWALGDCAAVPNAATPGTLDPPTSQHALRQGRRLARNLLATRTGRQPEPYRYRALGQVATLGRYKGIADVLGLRLSGFAGWFVTRSYHLYALPLLSRRIRVLSDWTLSLLFRRDVVSLGALTQAPSLAETSEPPPGPAVHAPPGGQSSDVGG